MAKNSDVETFCALRLFIDSWRWQGVPWYLRSGKCLAETATEVLVELKPPPQRLFADSAPADGEPTTCASGSRPIPPSRSPLASSAQGRSSLATSESSTWSKNSRERNRPTSGCWATLWPATERSSPARTRSRPPGRWSIRSLTNHHRARPYKRQSWGPNRRHRTRRLAHPRSRRRAVHNPPSPRRRVRREIMKATQKTPRNGPEPLARQHHPRPADQRHAPPLHPGFSVTGLTSNPTIFDHAIKNSTTTTTPSARN